MEPGGHKSRWTQRRRKKEAMEMGEESGGSDLSASDSDSEGSEGSGQSRKRQRNDAGNASQSDSDNEHESSDASGEEQVEEENEGEMNDQDEQLNEPEDMNDNDEHGEMNDQQEQLINEPQDINDYFENLAGNEGENGADDEGIEVNFEQLLQDVDDDSDSSNDSASSASSDDDSDDSGVSAVSDESNGSDESDDSEDGDVNQDPAENGDEPLYDNARITKMQSIMMILTLTMTFNLSGQCLVSILNLIELHCPAVNHCVKTLHNFKKVFKNIGRKVLILHYFCEVCFGSLRAKDSVCRLCQGNTKTAFFIEVPIVSQLQRLLLRAGFLEKLAFRFNRRKKHQNNYEDVFDGSLYQEHMGPNGFLRNPNNISFMWYTDGISIFKSSKFSVWPIYLIINELDYKNRTKRENILLAALWFGKSKPRPNLLLQPFRPFFETFKNDGFQFNVPQGPPITMKGMLLCGTCDLQAKGLFLRSKLSNGYYGCHKCTSPGGRVPAGGTTVHVHGYISPEDMQLRDNNQVPLLAQQKQLGYKGLSLLHLFMPSMINGTSIDIMHMVFLGLAKLLTKLWFDPKFSRHPYSCVEMIPIVNERLSRMKPPSFVERLTRTLSDLKLWKAKEFKNWFLYYSSVVMKGVLEDVYLKHHLKVVSAIALLCQESVAPEQVIAADALLNEYCRDFEALYSIRFMGMNVHLLLHLAQMVRELGPLWVYSCFFLEALNGQLVKLIHGPNQPGLQICSSASLFLSLQSLINNLPAQSIARAYCEAVNKVGMKYRIAEVINEKMMVVGKSAFDFNVANAVQEAVRNYLQIGNDEGHFQAFLNLRKSGVVFNCERKVRTTRRCSIFACIETENNVSLLCKIKEFIRYSNCNCQQVCFCVPAQHLCIVQEYEKIPWHAHDVNNVRLSYLSAVRPTDNISVFKCSEIRSLCFYCPPIAGVEYIAVPVNSLEYE